MKHTTPKHMTYYALFPVLLLVLGAGCAGNTSTTGSIDTTPTNDGAYRNDSGTNVEVRSEAEANMAARIEALEEEYEAAKTEFALKTQAQQEALAEEWGEFKAEMEAALERLEIRYENMKEAGVDAWAEARAEVQQELERSETLFLDARTNLNIELN